MDGVRTELFIEARKNPRNQFFQCYGCSDRMYSEQDWSGNRHREQCGGVWEREPIADLKKPLLPHELKLIAQFLDMASDEFGRHVCNDFDLPNTKRMRDMLIAMEKWNDPDITDESEEVQEIVKRKECFTMDYFVMSYMAHRVREALAEETS